jgi:hypothetical protein
MMSDEKDNAGTKPTPPAAVEPTAEERKVAARRRFLRQGAAAGSGVVIYTIHHNRSFAGGGGSKKTLNVSSPAACQSIGGSDAKQTKAVDSVNPVQKTKKDGTPVFDGKGNPVYLETKTVFQCTVQK